MAAGMDQMRLAVSPGEGLVARHPGCVLFVTPEGVRSPMVAQLLQLGRESADLVASTGQVSGDLLVRRVARLILDSDPAGVPPFCLLAEADGGLATLLYGAVQADGDGAGDAIHLSGTGVATWVDRMIDMSVTELRVQPAGTSPSPASPWADLRLGVVPAGAIVLSSSASAAAMDTDTAFTGTATPGPPPPPAAPARPVPSVGSPPTPAPIPPSTPPVASPSEATQEGPIGDAPGGAPARAFFAPVQSSSPPPSSPPRPASPPQGSATPPSPSPSMSNSPVLVVVSDGTRTVLEARSVLGREPQQDEAVKAGRARPIVINDEARTVSRVHAEIRLDGSDIVVADRRSVNGTRIARPGASDWTDLPANGTARIEPGTRLLLGQCLLTIEAG